MSNENGTETGTELVEYADWQVEDFVDSAEAAGVVDMFVYSFKQGGRAVTGLTARAIEELCLRNDPKISIIATKVDRTEDEVIAIATAQIVYQHPAVKETRPDGTIIETESYEEPVTADGIRVEPKMLNGRKDPHVEMKALTKAMRAARRQLISQQKQIEAKENLLSLQGGKPLPVPQAAIPQNTQAPPSEQTKQQQQDHQTMDTARKAMFAKYSERKAELEALGITEEILKQGLYKFYNVKSRSEMTMGQYNNARAALELESFAKWIRNLVPKDDEVDDALEGPNT